MNFSFLDDIERIGDEEYVPTVEDVLQSRARTIGVKEMNFHYNHHTWRYIFLSPNARPFQLDIDVLS